MTRKVAATATRGMLALHGRHRRPGSDGNIKAGPRFQEEVAYL
ncbi:hypothetical protein [Chitinophaga sp. HK235]|nr:hypothetical protein [Chitinophaga sp. HK235]